MTIDQVRTPNDGRVHVASDAVRLGLIVGVQSVEQTLAQINALVERRPGTSSTKVAAVAAPQSKEVPVTTTADKPAESGAPASSAAEQPAVSKPATLPEL